MTIDLQIAIGFLKVLSSLNISKNTIPWPHESFVPSNIHILSGLKKYVYVLNCNHTSSSE